MTAPTSSRLPSSARVADASTVARARIDATTVRGAGSRGGDVALRSLQQLEQAQRDPSLWDRMKRGVVVAMIGFGAMTAAMPAAHADTVGQPPAQTTSWVQTLPTGPPADSLTGGAGADAMRGFIRSQQLAAAQTPISGATQGRLPAQLVVAKAQASPARNSAVDAATNTAVDAFANKLTTILHHDAASLAQGLRPTNAGDPLSSTQQQAIEGAFRQFVQELPLGAFSDDAAALVNGALDGAGVTHADASSTRLKDLGRVGGDAAKQLVDRFRQDHPGGYWSMAGAAAAASVVVGATQGTATLAQLGIKPEFTTRLFSPDVKLHVGVHSGARGADFGSHLALSGTHDFGDGMRGSLRADVDVGRVGTQAMQLQGATLAGQFTRSTPASSFALDGTVHLDGRGTPLDARLSASQTWVHGAGNTTLAGAASWSRDDGATTALSLSGTQDRWTYSATGTYHLRDDHFTAQLSAGRQYSISRPNDAEIAIRASVDNHGASSIGVGATWRF